MKTEKVSRIVFTTDEHDYIATEAHNEGDCSLNHLSLDELVSLRDYLQTMVEIRVYTKHTKPLFEQYEEKKPALKLVGEPLDDCPHDKCFLCFDSEGFKL